MSGAELLWWFDKTVFEFVFLDGVFSSEIVLEPGLPVTPGDRLSLGIRVHGRVVGSHGTMAIEARSIATSDDAPQERIIEASPSMSIRIEDPVASSPVHVASGVAIGSRLGITLRATQVGSEPRLVAELSGALYGRAS